MTILPDTGLPDSKIFPEPDIGYRIPDRISGAFKLIKQTQEKMCKRCFEVTIRSEIKIMNQLYRVVKKKVLHKSERKMPKKMKMTLQRAENLVHVKQHYGDSICKKIFFLF